MILSAMPDGTGRAYSLIAHGSTVADTTVPVVSMKMTVPINRRSIRLPTGFFIVAWKGVPPAFMRGYVRHKSRKAMII